MQSGLSGFGWRRRIQVVFRGLAISMVAVAMLPGCVSERFVRVDGGRFELRGERHVFVGANFWQAVHMAMAGPQGDRERLASELDRLQDLGVNNIRILAAFEGPDGEPYRATPAMMIEPGQYNQAVLDGLDYLIAELDRRGMWAVVALSNFWEWSGGMAQFVAWDTGTSIPYPATHGWNAFGDFTAAFYGSDRCQQWYRQHIRTIIQRVNPYTGRAYRDEPSIFAWELANEPNRFPPAWIHETARFIKSLDRNHMVTTGAEGDISAPFDAAHKSRHIDYATIHLWPQNWRWYDPQAPDSYAEAEAKARDYFGRHAEHARKLGKPLVLEEFGLARDWEPGHDHYDPAAEVTHRNRFFAAMYDCVLESAAAGGPVAGSNFWAWSGQARPGEAWIGDPPHERPGWYSVYDADASTLQLIEKHAAALRGVAGR
ncbi:MAG: cellulase family glycosylhydrolase [Sedimentisphaerales bacterium]|nr:cellulase family glycosylhydrolase [Sedimentisphaerales bacterium]